MKITILAGLMIVCVVSFAHAKCAVTLSSHAVLQNAEVHGSVCLPKGAHDIIIRDDKIVGSRKVALH